MPTSPLSWNDPSFSGVTNSSSVTLQNGGALSYKSITDTGDTASVVGLGSFSLDHVRINSREGVRIGGDGDVTISNSYLESLGQGDDHADTIQIYAPGSTGNVTITNTTIVAHNSAATAGMFVADGWSGTLSFNNVVFQGGPFGLRVCADSYDISVSLKDVYFVGPFGYDDFLFQEVVAPIHITQWENVRFATIVNGELVPGALISSPLPVEPVFGVPTIDSLSDDSGIMGDGITHDNTLTLAGKAAANSTVNVFDGAKAIGTVSTTTNGTWSFTTAAVADGTHNFTATATSSGVTSGASTVRSMTVDTVAPIAPTITMSTSAATLASTHVAKLGGTAEASSTLKVFDGSIQIGSVAANSSGVWTYTTPSLADGGHNFTAKAVDVAGNTGTASAALAVTIATSPATPQIASYSTDSGKIGDGITNDNTLTLTGAAAASSTIKVYDGATQLGTTMAASNGTWSFTTAAVADGTHNFTATATSSGVTSGASTVRSVTVDTVAPIAPTITMSTSALTLASTHVANLGGTTEANSTLKVFDGSIQVGSAAANSFGVWTYTTPSLADGGHNFTAKAVDVAGNTGAASAALAVTIAPLTAAPQIASYSTDSGKIGDGITNDNTLTLTGSALASSTVNLFDGASKVGTAQVNSSGQWSLTTSALSDGFHKLTATDTDAFGKTSAASAALSVTIDSHAPAAPKMGTYLTSGAAVSGTTANNDFILKGTAEASSTVKVFDADKQIGTASTNSSGAWSFEATDMANGGHNFTSKAMDVAGNTSSASALSGITVAAPTTASIGFTDLYEGWNDTAAIKGTANAYTQIKLFDGAESLGSVKAGAGGTWSFNTSALSDTVHTFSAQQIGTGRVVATSPDKAILGSTQSDTVKSTTGDDFFVGNGGIDRFVFADNFGNDTIKDFEAEYAVGWRHDTIQFSKSVFDNFADVLAHSTQVGQAVVISTGNDSLTLKNATLSGLSQADFHFA